MSDVAVIQVEWSGLPGGTGLSSFAFDAGPSIDFDAAAAAVMSMFSEISLWFPNELRFNVLPEVSVYEHTTGQLVAAGQVLNPPAQVVGGSTNAYAAGVGASIQWITNGIANGHWVRGRTFLVPIHLASFNDTNGYLLPNDVTAFTNAAQNLIDYNGTQGDSHFVIWGRPKAATEDSPARPATKAVVASARVSSKPAVLRGRRD